MTPVRLEDCDQGQKLEERLNRYAESAVDSLKSRSSADLAVRAISYSAAAGAAFSMAPAAEAAVRYSGVINQTLSFATDNTLPWRSYSQAAPQSTLQQYVPITNAYGTAVANLALGMRYFPAYGGFGAVEFGTVGAVFNDCNSVCGFTDPNVEVIGGFGDGVTLEDRSNPQRPIPITSVFDSIGPAAQGFFNPLPIPGNDDRVIYKATYGYPHGPFGWIDNSQGAAADDFPEGLFAGFRFRTNSESSDYHYGWVRIAIRTDPVGRTGFIGAEVPDGYPMEARVVDWAYELEPNTAILPGDIGDGNPDPLPGDANGDGTVDLLDLDILGSNFGASPATLAQGDFNGDNVVDLLDLDILGNNFGATASSASATPEPTAVTLGLLALGAHGIAAHRRRCAAT